MPESSLHDLGAAIERGVVAPQFDELVGRAHRRLVVQRVGAGAVTALFVLLGAFAVMRSTDVDRQGVTLPADRPSTPVCGGAAIGPDGYDARELPLDPEASVQTWWRSEADDGADSTRPGLRVDAGSIYAYDPVSKAHRLILAPTALPDASAPGGAWDIELYAPSYSPDRRWIAFFDGMRDSKHRLRVMRSDGSETRVVLDGCFLDGAGHVSMPVWSPDGRRLSFRMDTTGQWVVGVDGRGLVRVAS